MRAAKIRLSLTSFCNHGIQLSIHAGDMVFQPSVVYREGDVVSTLLKSSQEPISDYTNLAHSKVLYRREHDEDLDCLVRCLQTKLGPVE